MVSLLTWNINHLQHSAASPIDYRTHPYDELKRIIVESNPDIVFLQEIPSMILARQLARELSMKQVSMAQSHGGQLVTLVNADFQIDHKQRIDPYIRAVFRTPEEKIIECYNVHLPHTKEAAGDRAAYFELIDQQIEHDLVIIAGDANMREAETKGVLNHGWDDAFFSAGSPKDKKYTWNSNENKFYKDGFGFHARFDRVFLQGFNVNSFDLVGSKPLSHSKGHFLSDHYGISVDLKPMI